VALLGLSGKLIYEKTCSTETCDTVLLMNFFSRLGNGAATKVPGVMKGKKYKILVMYCTIV
jgi:hypothetical protein